MYLMEIVNEAPAYLVSEYWPELANALSTCRGIAMLCLRVWSFLWVNGTGSTPPAPVESTEKEETRGKKTTGFSLGWCYHADTEALWGGWGFSRICLTKRLSNFFASVMWIQLSFSITLMCFTSSLNLKKKRQSFWNRHKQKGVLRCMVTLVPLKLFWMLSPQGSPSCCQQALNQSTVGV